MNAPPQVPAAGRGQMFVALMSCLERTMDDVSRTLPAVDHLSPPRARPDPDEFDAVGRLVQNRASLSVHEVFERWCALEREFSDAVRQLEDMHERAEDGAHYQEELEQRIHTVREKRGALRDVADELRDAVALDLETPTTS